MDGIDAPFFLAELLQGTCDELGLFTQLPALCLTLMGAYAGEILRNQNFGDTKKFYRLLLIGVICIALGLIWSLYFPIAKRMWSSSFIMLTGGMAFISMAGFYGIIDILQIKKWSFFLWSSALNILTIYLVLWLCKLPVYGTKAICRTVCPAR